MKVSPLDVNKLATRILLMLEKDPELKKLNGVELIAVLNSASGTLTACVAGQTLAATLKAALAEIK